MFHPDKFWHLMRSPPEPPCTSATCHKLAPSCIRVEDIMHTNEHATECLTPLYLGCARRRPIYSLLCRPAFQLPPPARKRPQQCRDELASCCHTLTHVSFSPTKGYNGANFVRNQIQMYENIEFHTCADLKTLYLVLSCMSSVLRCSHNSHFSTPHCVGRTKYENTDSSMIG